ncbi:hypothetical protein C6P45_004920 [Maudiozyma exigua]|uniref:alpha-1,2-Mannosidase n=1 Tax=Maudiozyma exigua TaxID=34358 RepID=A0A9P6W9M2_MAUEX|nr:hypothetical protein C6P45_004920 [Kazachstania exigua]
MSISKLVGSSIRRLKSVVILTVTISTLFYYTFQNEIDILNSYAENEYLPSINNEHIEHSSLQTSELISNLISVNPAPVPAMPAVQQVPKLQDNSETHTNNKVSINLNDPVVLKEKNKYFPLWLKASDLDPTTQMDIDATLQELTNYKEKYPLMYEVSLSSLYDDTLIEEHLSTHIVQPDTYQKSTSYISDLDDIRSILIKSWEQQRLLLLSADHDASWPIEEVDSLDTLYIMGERKLFDKIIERIEVTDFKIPPQQMEVIDIVDISNRLLGGMLSAYELSQNKILLMKAKDLADFLLRSFDTPNRVELLNYSWKTPFKNRFAYMDANIADLTKMTLEFTRLTQLTNSNKYFNTMFHIWSMVTKSSDFLNLDFLFPNLVDASTCSLVTTEEVQKGEHQRDSRIMKSIDGNLKFVHCHQLNHFPENSNTFELNEKLLPLYDTILQLYALTQTDLLKDPKQSPTSTIKKSSFFYNSAMTQINKFFKFEPMHPDSEQWSNMVVLANLDTNPIFSPSTNELSIQLRRDFKFHPQSCTLGATLSYGSKLFSNQEHLDLASKLTQTCFQFAMLRGGAMAEMSLDPCTSTNCVFNEDDKLQAIKDGKYVGFNQGFPKDTVVELKIVKRSIIDTDSLKKAINVNAKDDDTEDDKMKDETVDSDNIDRKMIKSFSFVKDENFMNAHLIMEDIDEATKQWKQTPERPLWMNSISNETLLSPDLIKSIFYMYRTTGDEQWRIMGHQLKEKVFATMKEKTLGPKGNWKIADLNRKNNPLPSSWFSQTLKYYYLLFSEPTDYSLDEYIFTDKAHLLKRRKVVSKSVRDMEQL